MIASQDRTRPISLMAHGPDRMFHQISGPDRSVPTSTHQGAAKGRVISGALDDELAISGPQVRWLPLAELDDAHRPFLLIHPLRTTKRP